MRTYEYARHGRIVQALKYYPVLCKTFEEWLVKYAHYSQNNMYTIEQNPSCKTTKCHQAMRFNTEQVFNLADTDSYSKCVIEFISGMTDVFAIQVYEEIISF